MSSIPAHFQRKSGKRYQVIGTESTGWKRHEAIDTIKSLDTGGVKKMTRKKLIEFIKS